MPMVPTQAAAHRVNGGAGENGSHRWMLIAGVAWWKSALPKVCPRAGAPRMGAICPNARLAGVLTPGVRIAEVSRVVEMAAGARQPDATPADALGLICLPRLRD